MSFRVRDEIEAVEVEVIACYLLPIHRKMLEDEGALFLCPIQDLAIDLTERAIHNISTENRHLEIQRDKRHCTFGMN